MDQELIAYLDRHFADLRAENAQRFDQIDARFEQIDSRFEQIDSRFERLEEEVRHGRVEVEGLRGQIQMLAECMIHFDDRLESFKGEVRREFESVRGMLFPPLESLQDRVRSVESWKEARLRDPIEVIKERFGPRDRQS